MNYETSIIEVTFKKDKLEFGVLVDLLEVNRTIQEFTSNGYTYSIKAELYVSEFYGKSLKEIEEMLSGRVKKTK